MHIRAHATQSWPILYYGMMPRLKPCRLDPATNKRRMLTPEKFSLGEPQISSRGAKTCTLECESERATFALGSKTAPTTTPFGANTFNDEDTARKNIEFRLTPEQDAEMHAFDDWAKDYLEQNSERLMKKKLSREQIEEHYRSPVRRQEGYAPLLRAKINVGGKATVRCWNEEGLRSALPSDLTLYALVPRLQLSHLYIMGRDFGWVINCTDLMILDAAAETECPF